MGEISACWFVLSNLEKWIDDEIEINLFMHDESNSRQLGIVHLKLDETGWYHRIMKATRYRRKGADFLLVHLQKRLSPTITSISAESVKDTTQ